MPFRSNTDKIEGLLELLDYPVPVAVFEELNCESLLEGVESVWQNRLKLHKILKNNVPRVIQATHSGYPNLLRNMQT